MMVLGPGTALVIGFHGFAPADAMSTAQTMTAVVADKVTRQTRDGTEPEHQIMRLNSTRNAN
jgi:hypothetical protein